MVAGGGATDGAALVAGESVLVSAGDDDVSVDAESVGLESGLGLVLGCGATEDAGPLGFGLHVLGATGLLDAVPRAV